ncbi:HD domain-containing protein [Cytophaga hutchinsonii]|jgi:(p)ppGpp synthase/HD superfamily hydrolase|uniref:Guanosine polyphosphate pyrophosphohydrolase n=1 Tax=Cytophaga hutchinsonii (strain ATCC 33406 / DSM 1761 / CIP 103989 / NBRC 15051 / NCIMB 9469 / D465) TaxID=269798 RepID=A0A6N4STF2_CYTH3|nr:HD domain-containing protein [Cytophaga hutchinsonii]ABG59647.1 guanosine polyphosphate pyrophosphohydrolase [Cytophaga hutchinsonii ATCC 33406]SFX66623.1 guanosine-3',5'-bis(diphosphate) 3'-pyrophosphohydrolase [Cytophaga hutchinsonii ATCC 33406]
MIDVQQAYQQAITFAAAKHAAINQLIPGTNLPYVVHISNVAMEILIAGAVTPGFNLSFAVQVALLHDVLEDTDTTFEEVEHTFGRDVADAVTALTKNDALDKAEKMADSLTRIKALSCEVWSVKLADRITNLQKPPAHWSISKIREYKSEADIILQTLAGGNTYLENRLKIKIAAYALHAGA